MFELPELPYSYDALEPYVDAETMKVHHDKHHQAYTNKLNAALEKYPEWFGKSIEEILSDLEALPKDIQNTVRNNGGGYYHHNLFWRMMSPDGGSRPERVLLLAIESAFGSFDAFQEQFTQVAMTIFGSGWAWLVKDTSGSLSIVTTSNQDSPISKGLKPLLGIDVWEHAYYLKYQNRRPDFITAWWNVVNWNEVENNFKS